MANPMINLMVGTSIALSTQGYNAPKHSSYADYSSSEEESDEGNSQQISKAPKIEEKRTGQNPAQEKQAVAINKKKNIRSIISSSIQEIGTSIKNAVSAR